MPRVATRPNKKECCSSSSITSHCHEIFPVLRAAVFTDFSVVVLFIFMLVLLCFCVAAISRRIKIYIIRRTVPVPSAVCSLISVPSFSPLLDPVTPPAALTHLPVTKDRSWVAHGWRQTAARVWRSAKGGGRIAAENARVSQRLLCSLQASFVGGANFPPPSPNKTYIFPQTAAKCVL